MKEKKISEESLQALEALSTPQEAQPHLEWDESSGTGSVTAPAVPSSEGEPDWGFVLERFGLSPEQYEVASETVRMSVWQSVTGEELSSYRAQIRRKLVGEVDVKELSKHIWAAPFDTPSTRSVEGHRVLMITDTHIGKSEEDGAGTELLVQRWRAGVLDALEDGKDFPFENVTLAFGGDLIEGYVSQNGRNIAGTDLHLPDQILTATQLVAWTIQEALDVANTVTVAAVPGNHGETTRVQGRTMSDSHDLQIIRQAEMVMNAAGFENSPRLRFIYPSEIWAEVVWNVGEATLAMVHGHTFSGKPPHNAVNWWSGHGFSDRPAGRAQILLCGHYHTHHVLNAAKDRWVLFGPALEDASVWFANKTGASGNPGIMYFDLRGTTPVGITVGDGIDDFR